MDVILIDLCAPCHADSDTNTLSDESDKLRQLLREQTDAKQSLQARILELQNELTLKLEALKSAEGELKSKVSQVADLEEGINRIITENEKLTRDNEVLQEEIAVMTAAVAPALNNKNCASDTIGTLPQVRREAVKGVRGAIHTGPLAGWQHTDQPTNQPTNERTNQQAMKHAWDSYVKYAWGRDELKPVSGGASGWLDLGYVVVVRRGLAHFSPRFTHFLPPFLPID